MAMSTKSKLRTSLITILLLLSSSVVTGAVTQQTKPVQPSAETIRAAVQELFGPAAEPAVGFNPYFVKGDFDGDGNEDVLVVVRIRPGRVAFPKNVKVLNPFGYGPAPASATEPRIALALIHGSRSGWATQLAAAKFLLLGASPILIRQNHRANSSDEAKDLMSLKRKRSRRSRNDPWPPAAARGDGIVLGTEATDSILYWDGKTYRWKEASGGE